MDTCSSCTTTDAMDTAGSYAITLYSPLHNGPNKDIVTREQPNWTWIIHHVNRIYGIPRRNVSLLYYTEIDGEITIFRYHVPTHTFWGNLPNVSGSSSIGSDENVAQNPMINVLEDEDKVRRLKEGLRGRLFSRLPPPRYCAENSTFEFPAQFPSSKPPLEPQNHPQNPKNRKTERTDEKCRESAPIPEDHPQRRHNSKLERLQP
ncbi:hypothetical protein M422DRAFT_272445 [Sphaerobolus stellatus SS14]|uniref:Uncharacterized protein n=1 Tax=Sphaerobolus stellatus (strain SS14) TaxID=990650 RepID=A0A0C9ULZ8_SPHS4|nr:hypothetical protein M422DRAFT_272445 [Sphaerobolus stellatus SS14]